MLQLILKANIIFKNVQIFSPLLVASCSIQTLLFVLVVSQKTITLPHSVVVSVVTVVVVVVVVAAVVSEFKTHFLYSSLKKRVEKR